MRQEDLERFDMRRKPMRTAWYLRPLTYLLSAPDVWKHRAKITRIRAEGLQPPYVLLCNHNAFLDFKVATTTIYPHRANYVVAIDGFIGREWLLRRVGCICKRKFTGDLTLICHGHHIDSPFWNLHPRGVRPTEAEFTVQYTAEELQKATPDEINARLVEAFQYDEYAWQKARGIRVTYPKRAEGLEKVLYQCPHCQTEYRMASEGTALFCRACGKRWQYTELGELAAEAGETEFSHIPDWYEWERINVRREVEAGTYDSGELPVLVRSLPNAKRFIELGEGVLHHDMHGFSVRGTDRDGDPFSMDIPKAMQYSCHIEYEYLGKYGDCVDLNTLDDTWYIYPHDCDFAVTKMALATEELYQKDRRDAGKPCKDGLA